MKNLIKEAIAFCIGAAVGSGVTYLLLKKRFTARVDSEVKAMKELYSSKLKEKETDVNQKKPNTESSKVIEKVVTDKPSIDEVMKASAKSRNEKVPVDYANFYSSSKNADLTANTPAPTVVDEKSVESKTAAKKNTKKNDIKVIHPDDFESDESYQVISLTYYSDGVLADEQDNKVSIEATIGKDALNHFGEYDDDVVYLCSDKKKCYYEVARDERTYGDVTGKNSYEED